MCRTRILTADGEWRVDKRTAPDVVIAATMPHEPAAGLGQLPPHFFARIFHAAARTRSLVLDVRNQLDRVFAIGRADPASLKRPPSWMRSPTAVGELVKELFERIRLDVETEQVAGLDKPDTGFFIASSFDDNEGLGQCSARWRQFRYS